MHTGLRSKNGWVIEYDVIKLRCEYTKKEERERMRKPTSLPGCRLSICKWRDEI